MDIKLGSDKHTRNQVCGIGAERSIPHPSLVSHKLLLKRHGIVILNLPYLDGRISRASSEQADRSKTLISRKAKEHTASQDSGHIVLDSCYGL